MVWPGSEGAPTVSKQENVASEQGTSYQGKLDSSEPQPGEAWLVEGKNKHMIRTSDGWRFQHGHLTDGFNNVTPIARLVPETPRKTLVTEEDYRGVREGVICLDEEDESEGVLYSLGGGHWMDGLGNRFRAFDLWDCPRTVIWEPEA